MLHTKFRGNRHAGSREGFLSYMGVANIMSSDLHFLVPESLYKKFGSDRHRSF